MKVVSSDDRVQLSSWSLACEYRVNEKKKIFDGEPEIEKTRKGISNVICSDDICALRLLLELVDGGLRVRCRVSNISQYIVTMEKIRLSSFSLKMGSSNNNRRFFTNGYQSWSETRSFKADEKSMVSILPSMVTLQDNARNLPSDISGEFTSDMFAVISDSDNNVNILIGQGNPFNQFFYVRYISGANKTGSENLQMEFDFGGMILYPGKKVECDEIYFKADEEPNELQSWYFNKIAVANAKKQPLPAGWCSWYYYYTGITETDIYENLDAMRQNHINWKYFVLDDGYQTAVGDWLSINNKFPNGLRKVTRHISEFSMVPGIWLAPFIARRNSQLYNEHRDWFLTDKNGKPIKAGWNPNWGIGGNFYALDTTNPDFQNYLCHVVHTMVHEWGFKYLKLDFTYAASLYGLAFNQELSSAERLTLGYRLIRKAAGNDVIILGCGSPLSPAIGHVDAMRIGPDVAPYWFAKYRYHLTRDPHALCTKFAIRNILNRCQMHRRLWINDPDCILLRDTDTKLTPEERMSLVNAVIVTGGMYLLSDRLSILKNDVWQDIKKIEKLVKDADEGNPMALDYMENDIPELVYNSRGYLAVFNFADKDVKKTISIKSYLHDVIHPAIRLVDVWNDTKYTVNRNVIDFGIMKPHSSLLCRIEK